MWTLRCVLCREVISVVSLDQRFLYRRFLTYGYFNVPSNTIIGECSEPLSRVFNDQPGGIYIYYIPPPLTVHFSMTRSVRYQPIYNTLYYTLHTEHAYCLSYRFLNNVSSLPSLKWLNWLKYSTEGLVSVQLSE